MFSCGYARTAVKEAYKKFSNGAFCNLTARKDFYDSHFENEKENFCIAAKNFLCYSKKLIEKFNRWRNPKEREDYLFNFSTENCGKKLASEKGRHSSVNCRGCKESHSKFQKIFEANTSKVKGKQEFPLTREA